jgi:hypothetical protein
MKASRGKGGWRGLGWGLAGGLLLLLIGDRGAQTAPPTGIGIDPFEVLDLQVKNNVLIVLDTSGSMKFTTDEEDFPVGADDPSSRMFQLKQAVKAVVNANAAKVNLGLATYNILATQKTVNRTADDDNDGNNRPDGPFIYVSADAAAAGFYGQHTNADDPLTTNPPFNEACSNIDGFFCQISWVDTDGNGVRDDGYFPYYDGTNSADVWRSFGNRNGGTGSAFDDPYPAGCTPGTGQLSPVLPNLAAGMRCRYYLQSRLIRNGVRYTWNRGTGTLASRLTATAAITCPTPPAGLLGYTNTIPPSATNPVPMCFQFEDPSIPGPAAGRISTFYYTSTTFQQVAGTDACGGGALLNQVAPCAGNNAAPILTAMDPELPVCTGAGTGCTAAGALRGVPLPPGNATFDFDGHLDGDNILAPDIGGLRAAQSTPLAGTLDFIRTASPAAFPAGPAGPGQKNFVILLTDGDDTCAGPSGTSGDRRAVLAAEQAELLFTNTGDFVHNAETLVVAFTASVNPARVNVIAQAGSGRDINQAAATPAAALTGAPCRPGGACRDAFFATSTQELIDILNAALEQASATGLFSATPSVFDGIPEYINTYTLEPGDPNDPNTRYPDPADQDPGARRAYRASFEVDGFRGFVKAIAPTGFVPGWEAGQSLLDRISNDLKPANAAFAPHTFVGLLGSPTPPAPPGGTDHINRRIFTSLQNGVSPARVMLWPPDTNPAFPRVVAPTGLGAGLMDEPLLRKPDGTGMSLVDLQATPFKACLGGPTLPPACTSNLLAQSTKEVREMILAFTAGAEAQRDGSGNPIRDLTTGEILYQARSWVLSESTLATPAVSVVPLQITPGVHVPEYTLYRDGPRTGDPGVDGGAIDRGFGMRNPDIAATVGNAAVKPAMSVVYVPANDMLHAFRGGPNCGGPPPGPTSCPGGEMGGQELWAYVPYDLLPKLKDRLRPQNRRDHTFMMAGSVRFSDVFVPGVFQEAGVTYSGKWRRILLAGRGIGGKHYSGLDITAPGPFTDVALATNLPAILWNRGNPDTNDGLATGTRNGSVREAGFYALMGQTWSTPIISRVNPATGFNNKEYVAFVGSGYGVNFNQVTKEYDQVPGQGTLIYTLDPVTGSVINDPLDTGNLVGGLVPNAVVANPVHYAPELLGVAASTTGFAHPAGVAIKSVFVGDLHGRMWKVATSAPLSLVPFFSAGVEQPIATPAALHHNLLGDNAATVFFETGYDARVTPGPLFKAYAVRDTSTPGVLVPGFPLDLPGATLTTGPYRGTLQPLTAKRADGLLLAFFVATRFNPITGTSCVSSFDSIIFGLNARTGGLVYGGSDIIGVKAVGVPRPPVDGGTSLDHGHPGASGTDPQTPLPPEREPPGGGGARAVSTLSLAGTSPVCRGN